MTRDDTYIDVVRRFADTVLALGRDRYGAVPTPLLVDGINVDTHEPVEWLSDGRRWVVCNPVCQMNLYRTLVGLTNLTGDGRYERAASEALLYFVRNHVDANGLPKWGGHRFLDLRSGEIVGEQDLHEFKTAYPYYELLWRIDAPATKRLIEALWNAHVVDWSNLDFSRHGTYDRPMGKLWDNEYVGGNVFFSGKGLTFINAGSDLIYAAGMLHSFTGNDAPLTWAKRLSHRYVEARDPITGLGAYQFSQPAQTADPAVVGTHSSGGDRARNQFGPEFGDRALEAKMLAPFHAERIYGHSAIVHLQLAELLGNTGSDLLEWTRQGLVAFARHAYDATTNRVIPMFTDGTRILPDDVRRPGYYRPAVFAPRAAGAVLLHAFALGFRLTGDPDLSDVAARMSATIDGTGSDPAVLLALLELWRATGDARFRELACAIGDNIVRDRFRDGLFLPSADHVNACFNALEPLALLTLAARLRGESSPVPRYTSAQPRIHGPHDGMGRVKDDAVFWSKCRPKQI